MLWLSVWLSRQDFDSVVVSGGEISQISLDFRAKKKKKSHKGRRNSNVVANPASSREGMKKTDYGNRWFDSESRVLVVESKERCGTAVVGTAVRIDRICQEQFKRNKENKECSQGLFEGEEKSLEIEREE